MKKLYLLFAVAFVMPIGLLAQNCTVNANIDLTICQNDGMTLIGTASGLFKAPSDIVWSQVAGPSVAISSPTSLTTSVIGYLPNNTYTFRLSATCDDGVKVFDDVSYTVLPITTANAGPDQTACPGTGSLAANSPGTNETAAWGVPPSNPAGVLVSSGTNPTSPITTPTTSAGVTPVTWTITNANGCISTDVVNITNYGGVEPVAVSPNFINLGNCYSTTQCYTLNGTFGGNGFGGQQGTWSQVSGPSNVTFNNVNLRNAQVCGLSEGCYVLKWTVGGPCANGSDTIRICVPKPTQSVSAASFTSRTYCDARTIAMLNGSVPTYAGERVVWQQTSGPGGTTIIDSSSATTAVTGLDGSSTYGFSYTIINDSTGCTSTGTGTIRYANGNPFIATIADTVLPCGITSVNLPFTASGGNQTLYRIVSAPDSWSTPTPTSYQVVTGGILGLNSLDAPGDYIVRMLRTTSSGVECSDYSLDFKVTISIKPLGASAGTDQRLACGITMTQLAGSVPFIGQGVWTQLSGPSIAVIGNRDIFNSNVSSLLGGVYDFKWVVNGGPACPKVEDTVRVIHSEGTPAAVTAGPPRTVCFGAPISLDANIPLDGEVGVWTVTPSAGVTINTINNPKAIVTGLVASTAYTFQWKVTNLCGADSSTVVITTNATQGPPQAMAGPDRCLASGTTSVTLAGNNPSPASGLWTKLSGPAATITDDTLYNTTVTSMSDGVYFFEWRNTNGVCDPTFDTVEITITGPVTTADAGSDIDSCSSSVTLAANTPTTGTGMWVQHTGPAGWSVDDINSPTARFTNLVTGEYQFIWSISIGSCASSTDTVTILIDNAPSIPTAGMGQKLCGGNSLTLSGNTLSSGSAVWSILGTSPNIPTIADANADVTLVTGLITGIYQFARTAYSSFGICPALQDTVSDTIIINPPTVPDQSFCGNQSVIDLTGPPNSIGTWSKILGGAAVVTMASANSAIVTTTNPAGSPYEFEYFSPSRWGCPATRDTVVITIDDTTNIPNAGTDKLLCLGTSVTMDGNNVAPNTSLWTQIFGPSSTITTPTSNASTITNINSAGIYLYRWTATSGVCRRADEVRIEKFDPPTVAAAGLDTTICPSEYTMSANTATTGVGNWIQISGPVSATIDEPVNPSTVITGLSAVGTYVFEWSIANGAVCPVSRDTMVINVPDLNPTVPNAGMDSAICNRNNSALNGNAITLTSGMWSQYTASPVATITSPASETSALTLPSAGTYGFVWTATNGGCVLADTVIYVMSDLPVTSNAGTDISTCIGEPLVLAGNDPSPNTGTWRQLSGPSSAIFSDSNSQTSNIFGIGVGTFDFRWQITSGSCPPSSDTVQLIIVDRPAIALAGADQVICSGLTTLSGSVDSAGTGTWSHVSGPNIPTIATPANETTSVTSINNGTHLFRWAIVSGGCTNEDTLSVFYGDPEVNNTCLNADSLSITSSSSGLDSLCSATAEPGEPSTCGKPACNSLMYKFRTNPSIWFQDLDINFTSLSNCSNGLRATLFEDGACPTLGPQHGTCMAVTTTGVITFPSLKPNAVYYLIIDDNSPTCGASTCEFEFELGGNALPVQLVSLDGELLNNTQTQLSWKTASELNTDRFEILRKASNSNSFIKVGEVKAAGNSSALLYYTWLDNVSQLSEGNIFYKLKTVDKNGDFSISNTIKVTKTPLNIDNVRIFPNPTNDVVNVSFNLKLDAETSIIIYDQSGKKVKEVFIPNSSGHVSKDFDLSGLAAGIYTIAVKSSGVNISEKLVILK
jgi:hypothetical protein